MNTRTTIAGTFATESGTFEGVVTVDAKSGLIVKVEKRKLKKGEQATHHYEKGNLIFAGMGDVHIHAREDQTERQNYKEDYITAAAAALHGGCVHATAMPNTPQPVVSKGDFAWHRKRTKEITPVTIHNYLGIDTKTTPIGKPGEYCYKLYFGKSVGDLTVTYASELDVILSKYAGHHISFHVEYEPIVQAHAKGRTHTERRPIPCVNEGLRLLLPLVEKYKIHAKLCHWSTAGESFELIEQYRKRGCDIVLEVSPLHLLFDTAMTDADPSLWLKVQMNPAIQSPEHRGALIKALKKGFIQFLATDHAPHTEEEKYSAFSKFSKEYPGLSNVEIAEKLVSEDKDAYLNTCVENGHSGAPWLDTYALVTVWLMKEHGFTPGDVARVAAYNPGMFMNRFLVSQHGKKHSFGKGFGKIEKGYVGSFTVLDTTTETTVSRESLKTKCGWSALEGRTFPGSVKAVIVKGVVY
ncbi:MAG: hypothetical protein RI911_709 [Candidatus Parcubacteria bacterium]|jgi:dihydroorotase